LASSIPSEKESAEWRREGEDLAKSLEPLLSNPKIGPRAKAYIRRMIESKNDFKAVARMSIERERHTCTLVAHNYRLDFKKIGEGKWVSNPGPTGWCKIVQVYTIERLGKFDWKYTGQVVARGGPKENPFCDWADEKEAKEVDVFRSDNVQLFEPSCEFIKYRLVPGS
jgi:hypothetical protein